MTVMRSDRVLCNAGNIPNSKPVATDKPAAKNTTGHLMVSENVCAASGGMSAPMPFNVHCAKNRLNTPPSSASNTDSVISCVSS